MDDSLFLYIIDRRILIITCVLQIQHEIILCHCNKKSMTLITEFCDTAAYNV